MINKLGILFMNGINLHWQLLLSLNLHDLGPKHYYDHAEYTSNFIAKCI